MQTSNTTVIEINGVKLEVDLRTARRVENIRVGTRVKVLQKKYSDSYEIRHGVVIGFEPFLELPTIIIAVAKIEYNSATVEFVYFNSKSEGIQIVVSCDDDLAALDDEQVTVPPFCWTAERQLTPEGETAIRALAALLPQDVGQ